MARVSVLETDTGGKSRSRRDPIWSCCVGTFQVDSVQYGIAGIEKFLAT